MSDHPVTGSDYLYGFNGDERLQNDPATELVS